MTAFMKAEDPRMHPDLYIYPVEFFKTDIYKHRLYTGFPCQMYHIVLKRSVKKKFVVVCAILNKIFHAPYAQDESMLFVSLTSLLLLLHLKTSPKHSLPMAVLLFTLCLHYSCYIIEWNESNQHVQHSSDESHHSCSM